MKRQSIARGLFLGCLIISTVTRPAGFIGNIYQDITNPKWRTPLMNAIIYNESDEKFSRVVEQARQHHSLNVADRDGKTAFAYLCESDFSFLKKIEWTSVLCAAGLTASGWFMSDAEIVLMHNVGKLDSERQGSRFLGLFLQEDNTSQFIRRNAFLIYAMNSSWKRCFKKGSVVSARQYQNFMNMLLQNYQKGNVITRSDFFVQELKKYIDFKKKTAPDRLAELTKSFDARVKQLVDMGLDIDFGKGRLFFNVDFVLSCAIENNDYDAVRILLKHGVDCCSITAGCTVLYDAAVYADSQIMDELLKVIKEKNRLDLVNYQSFGISTPLKIAVREKNKESVMLLLKAGALVDKSGPGSGGSALDECKDESLRSILVEHQTLQQKKKNDLKNITRKNAQWAVIV